MLTFLGLSVLLILTPGPNQALLTGRVLSGGRRAGFAAVRGTDARYARWLTPIVQGARQR